MFGTRSLVSTKDGTARQRSHFKVRLSSQHEHSPLQIYSRVLYTSDLVPVSLFSFLNTSGPFAALLLAARAENGCPPASNNCDIWKEPPWCSSHSILSSLARILRFGTGLRSGLLMLKESRAEEGRIAAQTRILYSGSFSELILCIFVLSSHDKQHLLLEADTLS